MSHCASLGKSLVSIQSKAHVEWLLSQAEAHGVALATHAGVPLGYDKANTGANYYDFNDLTREVTPIFAALAAEGWGAEYQTAQAGQVFAGFGWYNHSCCPNPSIVAWGPSDPFSKLVCEHTPREVTVFDDRGNCHVTHTFDDSHLDLRISRVRVVRKDGVEVAFAMPSGSTLRALVITQAWSGGFSEPNKKKKIAGSSLLPEENLYMINDHDASNYDESGCPAAGTGTGWQTDACAGTPFGLVSFGLQNHGLWADAGACNYEYGFLVQAMFVTPACTCSPGQYLSATCDGTGTSDTSTCAGTARSGDQCCRLCGCVFVRASVSVMHWQLALC